jgi:hypothetical protein
MKTLNYVLAALFAVNVPLAFLTPTSPVVIALLWAALAIDCFMDARRGR